MLRCDPLPQVNVDMGLSSSSKGHDGASCHAVFCSLEEVVTERSSRVMPSDQMQIIQRCQEYDPEVRDAMAAFGGGHRHCFLVLYENQTP